VNSEFSNIYYIHVNVSINDNVTGVLCCGKLYKNFFK
jgi:hypothetical protein